MSLTLFLYQEFEIVRYGVRVNFNGRGLHTEHHKANKFN
jgi:hypothetical protein